MWSALSLERRKQSDEGHSARYVLPTRFAEENVVTRVKYAIR